MLRIGSVALGFFGAAALFGVEEAESSQNARRSTARNSYFEIVADDSASAQFAGAVGEMLAKRVSRFMQIPSSAKRPIFVDLQPLSRFSGAAQFETEMYPNGNVKLLIAWGETTDRAILERALAQGFLTILASSYGEDRLVVPLWLELAVQQLARVSAVSSHRWALAERVKEGEPMSLREILSAERGMDREEELGAQAFWLFHFLESEARGRGQLEGFIVRLFRGEDPLE